MNKLKIRVAIVNSHKSFIEFRQSDFAKKFKEYGIGVTVNENKFNKTKFIKNQYNYFIIK